MITHIHTSTRGRALATALVALALLLVGGTRAGVAYAHLPESMRDPVAHEAGGLIPNNLGLPGIGGAPGDWQLTQWNFVGQFGVDAPEAWANVAAEGAPGGRA